MPNQNIVRPPVLTAPNPSNPPNPSTELETLVTRIVSNMLNRQNQSNNDNNIDMTEQTINLSNVNNLSDLDKIPDVVRCIREFSGIPGEFNSWKKSVDRILKVYEPIKGTPKFYGILSAIRNKITGQADTALESYNTPLNWAAISRCLSIHYADKRDLTTLEYQMTTMIQGNKSIQEFYHDVYTHLSLILDKISCMEVGTAPMELLTRTYRDKALDTFIRGLKGDLPRLLAMREPTELPQALHLCLKLENQHFRSHHANHSQQARNHNYGVPLPHKGHNHNNRNNRQPFYPQLSFTPQFRPNGPYINTPNIYQTQQIQRQGNFRAFPRPPLPAKPQPKPEPMDIDQSVRTKSINYMNQPAKNDLFGKRPPQQQEHSYPVKHQRNFNIQEFDQANYNQGLNEMDYQSLHPTNSYEDQQLQVDYEHVEHSDVHFLI